MLWPSCFFCTIPDIELRNRLMGGMVDQNLRNAALIMKKILSDLRYFCLLMSGDII